MTLRDEIIAEIIAVEGGYVDDPSDSGGETNYGVTVGVARAAGYCGEMCDMPREVACAIYTAEYWDAVCGDALAGLSEHVAREVVDTAVNMGPGRASHYLQRALNVLNVGGELYSDVATDGRIGPATISALRAYLEQRNELVLCRALNCLQGAYYIELTERREKDERFVYGWLNHRVTL